MFEATLAEGAHFKKLIEAMKDLFVDVNFDLSDNGIACQAMDSSHVCLCSVLLRAAMFDPYRSDRNKSIGMNIPTLSKVLKCAGNDETITISHDSDDDHHGGDMVTFKYEKPNSERFSKFEMKLMTIDSEHLGIPDTEYDAVIKLPSSEFSRICRDLSQFGDTVTIACTKAGINFTCNGDIGNGSIELKHQASVDDSTGVSIELNDAVTQAYAMRFLIYFSKAASLSEQVTLSICKGVPLVVSFNTPVMADTSVITSPPRLTKKKITSKKTKKKKINKWTMTLRIKTLNRCYVLLVGETIRTTSNLAHTTTLKKHQIRI